MGLGQPPSYLSGRLEFLRDTWVACHSNGWHGKGNGVVEIRPGRGSVEALDSRYLQIASLSKTPSTVVWMVKCEYLG